MDQIFKFFFDKKVKLTWPLFLKTFSSKKKKRSSRVDLLLFLTSFKRKLNQLFTRCLYLVLQNHSDNLIKSMNF